MIVVVLGPPGAGKGTQCKQLAERLVLPHVSTGDLLREAIAQGSALGKLAEPYLDRGELVPDETMIQLVRERLLEPDAERGVILDGFPRTIDQARGLNRTLEELGRKVDRVLYLRVPLEVVLERVSKRFNCAHCGALYHLETSPPLRDGVCDVCGGTLEKRLDDRPDVVQRRLEVYETQTAPLVDFYRAQKLLSEIDGSRGVEQVLESELRALGQLPVAS